MSRPGFVSIVLPTYNRRRVLGDAVASVLAQTLDDLELIIVDDASNDGERPQVSDFDDSRITLIQRESNGGVAAAQNTGLAQARGELLAFIHSDDVWTPKKLADQSALIGAAGADVVGVESSTIRLTDHGATTVAPRLAGATYADLLERRVRNLHIGGFLFRRDALAEIGGFDESLRAYEDLDLLIRLRRQGPFVTDETPVATIDQRGADRLGSSPWMAHGREYLLDKYEPELLARRSEFPAGWRDWSAQAGLAALDAGDRPRARRRLRRSMGRQPRLWLMRAPLLAASYTGGPLGRRIAAIYRRRLE